MSFSGKLFLFPVLILSLCQCQRPRLAAPRPALDPSSISEEMTVAELLTLLGANLPDHHADEPDPNLVEAGREIVRTGKTTHPETGQETIRISAYFYCTDCHNNTPESEKLTSPADAAARLAYLHANDLPLVPGSTFAGIVNRESWYNGDYAEKYGLSPEGPSARNDLREAIKLCSRECSSGRDPEEWEIDAMLAYFQSLQWRMPDLGMTGADIAELKRRALNQTEHSAMIEEIRGQIELVASASFGEAPENPEKGYEIEGEPDPENGKVVFERACLHCHGPDGASEHFFGNKPATWRKLADKFSAASGKSLYHLIRNGTKAGETKGPYMPNFTKERMSNQQIEDLRAYVEQMAEATGSSE